ncbi:alpha/beta fold hydrolase [Streptacidiphilus sp. 4-A2]|nr:alpha/beta fold hydrolase [Streptacidiphilus sp. 4-A2]
MTAEAAAGAATGLRRFTFRAGDATLAGFTVAPRDGGDGRTAVLLHGAGTASKERLLPLALDLAEAGVGSVALDFAGHGDSSGELSGQSLAVRHAQAVELVEGFVPSDHRLTLVGFSMSGQTVADLLATYGNRVSRLCLCAPAVYDAAARDVPFGHGFTDLIRRPGSWRTSDAFAAYARFAGQAVLLVPGRDEVIPPDVTSALRAALATRSELVEIVLHDAGHRIGLTLANRPDLRRSLVALLAAPE